MGSEALFGPLSLVTFEPWGAAMANAHAWKLLEGLSIPAPPTWDLLDLPHGPFQQFYREDRGILLFGNVDLPVGLRARLRSMLVPERHWLASLDASLPGLLGTFEHAAALDALIVAALRARPRDLSAWPGLGQDGPLYEIDRPALCAESAPSRPGQLPEASRGAGLAASPPSVPRNPSTD